MTLRHLISPLRDLRVTLLLNIFVTAGLLSTPVEGMNVTCCPSGFMERVKSLSLVSHYLLQVMRRPITVSGITRLQVKPLSR